MNAIIPTELGTERVGRLLRQYAVPAIIAMTASSLYNMVDSIFIGQGVGPYAISGLALTFPLMNLAAAFGTLVGVGASTLLSVLLGQRNYDVARRVLGNVVILNLAIGLLFTVVALIFLDPILYFFGASEQTIGYARDYMVIILSGNAFSHLYFGLNSMMRSSGHPKLAMTATILTVLLNAALDPLFIFVFGMGIRGAAIATILAQLVSLGWLIYRFTDRRELIHFEHRIFRLDWRIARESLAIGMAPFLMNFVSCFIVIFLNQSLKKYGGDLAIGAYGIVNRVAFLFLMICLGLTQGMQPIAGYNFGARQYDRVKEVLWKTMGLAVAVMTAGFLVCELFPDPVVSIFTRDEELIGHASRGLRTVMLSFPLVGVQVVISNFFQSLGFAGKSIFLSLSRQLIFLLPLLLVLPQWLEIRGVWLSLPLSDIIAFAVAVAMIVRFIRNFKPES